MDMTARQLERVIYYEDYLVVDPGKAPLLPRQLLSETEYREAQEQYGDTFNGALSNGRRSRSARFVLQGIDLASTAKDETEEALGNTKSKQTRKKVAKQA